MTRLRLRQLVIASETLETATQLKEALDLGPPFHDPGVKEFGLENAVFAIGDQFLEIVAPVSKEAPARRFIEKNGPGGYMVIFETDDIKAARTRVDGAGIRRVWDIDLEDIAASHLHPGDVGAAIVSIDEASPWGSWRWGGPKWQQNAAPGELTGAILESENPERLASRWAAALGIPASTGPEETKIRLEDDQALTFQEGAETRLEGFCVTVRNAMKTLERADKLGIKTSGDGLMLSGVRLVLNND